MGLCRRFSNHTEYALFFRVAALKMPKNLHPPDLELRGAQKLAVMKRLFSSNSLRRHKFPVKMHKAKKLSPPLRVSPEGFCSRS